jgi:hypothetical protein
MRVWVVPTGKNDGQATATLAYQLEFVRLAQNKMHFDYLAGIHKNDYHDLATP